MKAPARRAGAFRLQGVQASPAAHQIHLSPESAMPIWDKLRTELDRAGRAAQQAIDEGRVRLDAFRARQLADRAAQALGYAVYRARLGGGDIDPDAYGRLSATLAGHEAEAARLEARLREPAADRPTPPPDAPTAGPTAAPGNATEPPPAI
jgi:hypothetical protein